MRPVRSVFPRRSRRPFRRALLGALLLIAAGLSGAPPAAAETPISLAEYRQRLAGIELDLRRGDGPAARREAGRLERERIAFAGRELAPDLSVLGPLAGAPPAHRRAAAAPLAFRLSNLVTALTSASASPTAALAEPAGAPADLALLSRLRRAEALSALPAGGRLPDPGVRGGGLFAAIREFLEPLARAVAAARERLFRWLERWLRSLFETAPGRRPAFGLRGVVAIALGLALGMLALAVQAMLRSRRRRAAADPRALPAQAPAEDDDPLSRGAGEWETYARELAAAGRHREAIRAWYHAVLVALYQGGLLHFRPGRTNWEYVSTVPPGTLWRPVLIEITRQFEREWYGRERSSAEALATSQEAARALLAALRSSPA